jgi:signal transduction histidine kinase
MAPLSSITQKMTTAGLNLIQQALSIYDSDLKLVVSNNRFREMFSLPERFVTPGASFPETILYLAERGEYGHIGDFDEFIQGRISQALAFEPHYVERKRPDGRWVSVEGSPLPAGGWVTVYTDISSTKRQENLLRARSEVLSDQLLQHAEELSATNRKLEATVTALEEAKRQLTESEARTRLTTEMMPAHIAHVGPDCYYTYSNRRLSSVMPGRPSNLVGVHIGDALGESAYTKIRPHLEAALNGSPSVFEFNDQLSTRRIRVAFTPDAEEGVHRGAYILSMDITEETQTRAALQQTRRRELAAQMTSGLAHDFSNLLTIILGMQSRMERFDLPQDAHKLVEATLAAARRGGTLLNRIADMTGHSAPKLEAVEMSTVLGDLQTLAGPTLSNDMHLRIENDVPSIPILLDPGTLQDALLNLILNAKDACEEQGAISLHAKLVHDTWLQITINDTGTGFSEEALTRALDPFFTTKGDAGSGLGLAMVYDTIKLMGGEVRLANTDTGAQVTLRLPLRKARTDDQPGLVLLVEDTPDLRSVIRDMLTQQGHTVIEAASVDEALVLIKDLPEISLILTDISLEGETSGVDLIRQLPNDPIPFFLMTSLPPSHPLYIEGATLAPVLPKPFTAEELATFLHSKVRT